MLPNGNLLGYQNKMLPKQNVQYDNSEQLRRCVSQHLYVYKIAWLECFPNVNKDLHIQISHTRFYFVPNLIVWFWKLRYNHLVRTKICAFIFHCKALKLSTTFH